MERIDKNRNRRHFASRFEPIAKNRVGTGEIKLGNRIRCIQATIRSISSRQASY